MYTQRNSCGPVNLLFNYRRNYEEVAYIHMFTQRNSFGPFSFLV